MVCQAWVMWRAWLSRTGDGLWRGGLGGQPRSGEFVCGRGLEAGRRVSSGWIGLVVRWVGGRVRFEVAEAGAGW